MRRTFVVGAALGAAVVSILVTPAWAAPPANDSESSPRDLVLMQRISVDTRDATGMGESQCGVFDESVWFRYLPDGADDLVVDTTGSDYDTHVVVHRVEDGSRTEVACNDDAVGQESVAGFRPAAGATYLIEVGRSCHEYWESDDTEYACHYAGGALSIVLGRGSVTASSRIVWNQPYPTVFVGEYDDGERVRRGIGLGTSQTHEPAPCGSYPVGCANVGTVRKIHAGASTAEDDDGSSTAARCLNATCVETP